jgi:hypothetical protein
MICCTSGPPLKGRNDNGRVNLVLSCGPTRFSHLAGYPAPRLKCRSAFRTIRAPQGPAGHTVGIGFVDDSGWFEAIVAEQAPPGDGPLAGRSSDLRFCRRVLFLCGGAGFYGAGSPHWSDPPSYLSDLGVSETQRSQWPTASRLPRGTGALGCAVGVATRDPCQ